MNSYIEPVQYNLISFDDISYTDCFEISLLRFLHLVFSDKINEDLYGMLNSFRWFIN